MFDLHGNEVLQFRRIEGCCYGCYYEMTSPSGQMIACVKPGNSWLTYKFIVTNHNGERMACIQPNICGDKYKVNLFTSHYTFFFVDTVTKYEIIDFWAERRRNWSHFKTWKFHENQF